MENIIYYDESEKNKNQKSWKLGTSTKEVMYALLDFSLLHLDVLNSFKVNALKLFNSCCVKDVKTSHYEKTPSQKLWWASILPATKFWCPG